MTAGQETAPDATPSSAASEWKKHWPLVVTSTAGMSLAAVSTSAFGVMVVPIEQDVGWSRTEISTGPALISLMTVLFGTVLGAALDKFGPRLIAIITVTMLCGATALQSRIGTQLWQWWALWTVIGLSSAVMSTLWVAPITRTFHAGRGLAMAIVLSGSGLSSFIVPNLANHFVESAGWRTAYLYLAMIWFAMVITLVLLFLRLPGSPRPDAAADSGPEGHKPAPEILPGLTAREGFRSPAFYKLMFGTVIANFVGIAMLLNMVPILRWNGLSAASAAAVYGSVGIATITGRLVCGTLMDRFSVRHIAAGAAALMTALPVMLLAFPGSVPASLAGIVVYGMVGGAIMPCIAYLSSRHLGQRAFGTLFATIMAAMSLGVGIGPLLANLVYDTVNSYAPVLWAAIPAFLIGMALFLSLGPYPDFSRKEAQS